MSAAGDPRPCGGDAFVPVHNPDWWGHTCTNCQRHFRRNRDEICMGNDYFFLPVALEVAGERKIGPSSTGGTVTDVTLYPAGTDPRLGLEDVTEWWEFP